MNFGDLVENIVPKLEGHHIADVNNIMQLLQNFHKAKEEQYQLSFAKRGEMGVWYNLGRQADRMDGVAKLALQGEHTAALVDTLVDMAIYSIKWLAVILALRPEDFQKWLKDVYCPYMELDYEYMSKWFEGDGRIFGGFDYAKEDSEGTIWNLWHHHGTLQDLQEFPGLDSLLRDVGYRDAYHTEPLPSMGSLVDEEDDENLFDSWYESLTKEAKKRIMTSWSSKATLD